MNLSNLSIVIISIQSPRLWAGIWSQTEFRTYEFLGFRLKHSHQWRTSPYFSTNPPMSDQSIFLDQPIDVGPVHISRPTHRCRTSPYFSTNPPMSNQSIFLDQPIDVGPVHISRPTHRCRTSPYFSTNPPMSNQSIFLDQPINVGTVHISGPTHRCLTSPYFSTNPSMLGQSIFLDQPIDANITIIPRLLYSSNLFVIWIDNYIIFWILDSLECH